MGVNLFNVNRCLTAENENICVEKEPKFILIGLHSAKGGDVDENGKEVVPVKVLPKVFHGVPSDLQAQYQSNVTSGKGHQVWITGDSEQELTNLKKFMYLSNNDKSKSTLQRFKQMREFLVTLPENEIGKLVELVNSYKLPRTLLKMAFLVKDNQCAGPRVKGFVPVILKNEKGEELLFDIVPEKMFFGVSSALQAQYKFNVNNEKGHKVWLTDVSKKEWLNLRKFMYLSEQSNNKISFEKDKYLRDFFNTLSNDHFNRLAEHVDAYMLPDDAVKKFIVEQNDELYRQLNPEAILFTHVPMDEKKEEIVQEIVNDERHYINPSTQEVLFKTKANERLACYYNLDLKIFIVPGEKDPKHTMFIRDFTGKELILLNGYPAYSRYTAKGECLLINGRSWNVFVVQIQNNTAQLILQTNASNREYVRHGRLLSDGKRLITWGYDHSKLQMTELPSTLVCWNIHVDGVDKGESDPLFNKDESLFVVPTTTNTLKVFDTVSGQLINEIDATCYTGITNGIEIFDEHEIAKKYTLSQLLAINEIKTRGIVRCSACNRVEGDVPSNCLTPEINKRLEPMITRWVSSCKNCVPMEPMQTDK